MNGLKILFWIRRITKQIQKMSFWKNYFLTLFSSASFVGILGAYSYHKKSIAHDLSLSEEMIGFLDGVSYLLRFAGTTYMLVFPTKTPIKTYFLNNLLAFLSLLVIPLCPFVPQYAKILLVLSQIISGFFRSSVFMATYIFSELIDCIEHAKLFNIWFAIVYLSDPFALLCNDIMFHDLQLSWEVCFSLSCCCFLLPTLVLYLCTPEISSHQESQGGDSGVNGENEQNKMLEVRMRKIMSFFAADPKNSLWFLECLFQTSLNYTIFLWFPYFYMQMGFGLSLLLLCSIFACMVTPGSFCLEHLKQCFPESKKQINFIFLFIALLLSVQIFLVSPIEENSLILTILIGLMGFFHGGPSMMAMASEAVEISKGDRGLKYLLMIFLRAMWSLLSFVIMIVVGFVMQKDMHYLFYVIIFMVAVPTALNFTRKFLLTQDNSNQTYEGLDESV